MNGEEINCEMFQNIVSVFEAVIAFANLIVIIYFTNKERKEKEEREREEEQRKSQEREEEKRQRRRETIYSKIVVGRLFEVVDRYFDDCVEMIEQIKKKSPSERMEYIEELSDRFQTSKRVFKQTILPLVLSLNKEADQDIRKVLEEHEDKIMNALEKNPFSWYAVTQHVDKTRVEIMKALLKMELDF